MGSILISGHTHLIMGLSLLLELLGPGNIFLMFPKLLNKRNSVVLKIIIKYFFVVCLSKINRKNGNVFLTFMVFFITYLTFYGLRPSGVHNICTSFERLKTIVMPWGILDTWTADGNAEECGNLFMPIFLADCWTCYFACLISYANSKRSPPKAPTSVYLSCKYLWKHVVISKKKKKKERSFLTVIAMYSYLWKPKK